MAITSMTGFGRSEGVIGPRRWVWELKSVNGRGLDVKARTPTGFDALDAPIREAIAAHFKRGSIQASLTLTRDAGQAAAPRIDVTLVRHLIEAGRPFVTEGLAQAPSWEGLLSVRGVLINDDQAEDTPDSKLALDAALKDGLVMAVAALAGAREQEGKALERVLNDLLARIESATQQARAIAAAGPQAALDRIRARLSALLQDVQLDPQRLAQEAALIAARADVAEELERLSAHAQEARTLLASPEPAGRRLDFLGQELMREANTLSAKSADLALTRLALDLKTAVDQFKEQCANVE
jgi:uncharacterized protein (TIGR00255 family)